MKVRHLIHGNPETIAGTVYGTVVVLSMVTAGAADYAQDQWRLVAIVASGMIVLWAAHVYSHALGESSRANRRLDAPELAQIARREASILLAGVVPTAAITIGALDIISARLALWFALGAGVAALTVQGVRYARLEDLGPAGTALTVAVNLAFGLVFVGLKALLVH